MNCLFDVSRQILNWIEIRRLWRPFRNVDDVVRKPLLRFFARGVIVLLQDPNKRHPLHMVALHFAECLRRRADP